MAKAEDAIYVVPDTDTPKIVIGSLKYNGIRLGEPPEVPAGLVRDVLVYKEKEPPMAWRGLYSLIGIFTLILSFVTAFLPVLILPARAQDGWIRQPNTT
jgi:hypothetical protein